MNYGRLVFALAVVGLAACAPQKQNGVAGAAKASAAALVAPVGSFRQEYYNAENEKNYITIDSASVTATTVCKDGGEKILVSTTSPAQVSSSHFNVLTSSKKSEMVGSHECVAELKAGVTAFEIKRNAIYLAAEGGDSLFYGYMLGKRPSVKEQFKAMLEDGIDGATALKDGAINGATYAKDSVINGATAVKDGVLAAPQAALNGATKAKEAVINGATYAKDSAINGATFAKESAINGATKVKEGVLAAPQAALNGATAVKEAVINDTTRFKDNTVREATAIKNGVVNGATFVKDGAIKGATYVKENAGAIAEKVVTTLGKGEVQ